MNYPNIEAERARLGIRKENNYDAEETTHQIWQAGHGEDG